MPDVTAYCLPWQYRGLKAADRIRAVSYSALFLCVFEGLCAPHSGDPVADGKFCTCVRTDCGGLARASIGFRTAVGMHDLRGTKLVFSSCADSAKQPTAIEFSALRGKLSYSF